MIMWHYEQNVMPKGVLYRHKTSKRKTRRKQSKGGSIHQWVCDSHSTDRGKRGVIHKSSTWLHDCYILALVWPQRFWANLDNIFRSSISKERLLVLTDLLILNICNSPGSCDRFQEENDKATAVGLIWMDLWKPQTTELGSTQKSICQKQKTCLSTIPKSRMSATVRMNVDHPMATADKNITPTSCREL